ncbi:hypothetical protein LTT66_18010 [Nocardia gipuzkoensis]|uniref:hypothetical protein n=1 Tax=Nocardia gipuzkoensis TaxID=2749991 RepID=UPI001E386439|nr:hypothetical protein [Nocardia gipuzkoensis]UGT71867.1 hypothetical protein LTT66_18010 [Nocardia gipuzkoensis]
MTRLHMPHPHIGERIHNALEHFRHRVIVPDGHDWPEWHYADAKPDWEDRNEGGK